MKESEEIVSSAPLTRVPYPPLRGPPSPMGKAIKLSGRTFLAPHRGGELPGEGRVGSTSGQKKLLYDRKTRCPLEKGQAKGRGSMGQSMIAVHRWGGTSEPCRTYPYVLANKFIQEFFIDIQLHWWYYMYNRI